MSCFSFRQFSNQLDMKLSCWQLSVDPTKKEPIPRCRNSLLDGNEAFQEARLCFPSISRHTICGSCGSTNVLNQQNENIEDARTPVEVGSFIDPPTRDLKSISQYNSFCFLFLPFPLYFTIFMDIILFFYNCHVK